MESYDRLVQLVADVTDDMAKCEGGNKAAGTRVRKAMQDIKAAMILFIFGMRLNISFSA